MNRAPDFLTTDVSAIERATAELAKVREEIGKVIIGQRDVIDVDGAAHGCHRTGPMSRSLGDEERRVTVRRRPGTVPSVAMADQRWQYRVTLRRPGCLTISARPRAVDIGW